MKAFTTLGLLLALSPAAALAQTAAPDTALPPHPSFAAMEQMHAQMEQLHQQARLQMLAALTPAGYEARIDLTMTDEGPTAHAFVVISAVPVAGP